MWSAQYIFNFLLVDAVFIDVWPARRRIDVVANLHAAIVARDSLQRSTVPRERVRITFRMSRARPRVTARRLHSDVGGRLPWAAISFGGLRTPVAAQVHYRIESRQAVAFSKIAAAFSDGTKGRTVNEKNVAHGAVVSSIDSADPASTIAIPPLPSA